MVDFLKQDVPVAKCYFADNDQIAAGAIKAFIEKGYKVISNGTDNHLMLVDLRTKFPASHNYEKD